MVKNACYGQLGEGQMACPAFSNIYLLINLTGIKFYKPPTEDEADPKNIASDEEMAEHIYSRHGSITNMLMDVPDDQTIDRMDTIGEDEEEDSSSQGSGDVKKVIPPNGVIYQNDNVKKAPVITEEEEPSSSSSSSSEGYANKGYNNDDESISSTSTDSIDSGDGDAVQGYTFGGGDSDQLSTAL